MFQGCRGLALLLIPLVGSIARAQPAVAPQEASSEAAEPAPPPAKDVPSLKLGGMFRFSYLYKSWEQRAKARSRGGDVAFDTFSLRTQAQYKNLSLNAEYRFYAGFSFLRYGYLGYAFSDSLQVQVGDTQAPFGILPVPSNNWFNNLTFYVGLEDDSDMGVKALLKSGALDVQLAFFKGDEGSFTGQSLNSARYAFDLVRTKETELESAGVLGARTDRESAQGNARLAYTFQHTPAFRTEVGLSGMAGGIYNLETQRTGWRWAAAAHLDGRYGPVGVHLQAVSYAFNSSGPLAHDRRFVVMGAFDGAYKVASRAHLLVADVSYTWELGWGPIDSLVFYNDLSLMVKPEEGFSSSQQNVTGVHVAAGPIHAFLELAAGRNHPFLGPDFATSLAEGREGAGWGFRPNLNVGYYF